MHNRADWQEAGFCVKISSPMWNVRPNACVSAALPPTRTTVVKNAAQLTQLGNVGCTPLLAAHLKYGMRCEDFDLFFKATFESILFNFQIISGL